MPHRSSSNGNTLFAVADFDAVARAFLAALKLSDDYRHWTVTLDQIRGRSRHRQFAWPRQCLAYLLRELTGASFPAIAGYLRREDHTTIMHACRVVPDAREPNLARAVATVLAAGKSAAV